jgi:hypothetical protein
MSRYAEEQGNGKLLRASKALQVSHFFKHQTFLNDVTGNSSGPGPSTQQL